MCFSRRCPSCSEFRPKWEAVADTLVEYGFPVCDLDCETYDKTCDAFKGLRMYPTYWLVIKDDIKFELMGHQNVSTLVEKVRKFL